jgi:hypothetical protein
LTRLVLGALAAAATVGCAARGPTYYWGSYETSLYEMYRQPGKALPETQVARLTEDIERAEAAGQRTPPGVHAHLGYMLYLQGNTGAAARELEAEKLLYPESARFVDGLLERLRGGQ